MVPIVCFTAFGFIGSIHQWRIEFAFQIPTFATSFSYIFRRPYFRYKLVYLHSCLQRQKKCQEP